MIGVSAFARLAAGAALVIALAGSAQAETPKTPASPGADVKVGAAHIKGQAMPGGINAFLGIPYADPPVGARRWHVSTLSHLKGTVDATHFGAICPQGDGTTAFFRRLAVGMGSDADVVHPAGGGAEDCLMLNIWAPAAKAQPAKHAAGLPVMVWIHGGSNTSGFGSEPDYRGSRLAGKGVIVVTLNYRLGALGFFAHPAIADVSAGRQGLSDQITALRWVHDNIAAFGGDPARVTVFGESAGGTDVVALMHMDVARGLFARAIIESGYLPPTALATPAAATRAAIDLYPRDATADAMQAHPVADVVKLGTTKHKGAFAAPLVPARAAFRVPLLIGTNSDEFRMFLPSDPATRGDAEAAMLGGLKRGDDAAHLLKRLSDDGATRADLLASAPVFHCPAAALAGENSAGQLPAYVYRFDRVRPGNHGFGAYHGAEIPYVFGTGAAWLPADGADRALSDKVMRYWVNFARTGNPNGPGLPSWPRWPAQADDIATVPVMHLGTAVHAAPLADLALCPLVAGK
ncbi:carboxylesterase/lipase family protein [Novosphingobium sp.]|uniref:carboxylesterase/lipase family protein n=1 Tax=Novosphingobium sp. TaxID=1874826 RepID=UPI003B5172ED